MPKRSPSDVAEKWARKLKAASEDIRRGVEATTKVPSAEAIKQKEAMRAHLIEAIDKGIWERNLSKYTLDQWKSDMINKALTRIPSGVDAARSDFESFMSKLLPHVESGLTDLEKKPKLTLEDSIARVEFWIRHMAKFKKS